MQQFAGLVFGVAIGAALIFFLLMPGRVGQLNDEIDDYQTQLTESVDRVEELESQQTDNESKIRSLEAELADAVEKNTNLSEKRWTSSTAHDEYDQLFTRRFSRSGSATFCNRY